MRVSAAKRQEQDTPMHLIKIPDLHINYGHVTKDRLDDG